MMAIRERHFKPLGRKSYGHIMHLPGSRTGPGDHMCTAGQARIATARTRDEYDLVIVQEKVDGSNVGIARVDGVIYPLNRTGHMASTSPHENHWRFAEWVYANQSRWLAILGDGEWLCGEWLMQAHGTRYRLPHEPLVVFDLMREDERAVYDELLERTRDYGVVLPRLIHRGGAFSVAAAMEAIKVSGHGALDPVEGAVWRVERQDTIRGASRRWRVEFLVKYVRPDKRDGAYLPVEAGSGPVWNWRPEWAASHGGEAEG